MNLQSNLKKLWACFTKLNVNASFVGCLIIRGIAVPLEWLLVKMFKETTLCSKIMLATMTDPHVRKMCVNVPRELHPSATSVIISKIQLSVLLDSCSTDSHIGNRVAQELKLEIHPSNKNIILAQKRLNTISRRCVVVNLHLYLNSLPWCPEEFIFGQDFQHLSRTHHKKALCLTRSFRWTHDK